MMIRVSSFIVIAFLLISSACSQQRTIISSSEAEYTRYLNKLSGSKLEDQLRRDAAALNAVLDSLKGFQFYYMIGFGGGAMGNGIDTAQAFTLPVRDTLKQDLYHPDRKLYFNQVRALPEPDFRFLTGYATEAFEQFKLNDLAIRVEKIYRGNQVISPGELQLRYADSLWVETVYQYPLSFDTLVIRSGQKDKLQYGDHEISIDRFEAHEASFSVPVELSEKIIAYRGLTGQGVLINSNSYSKFPVTAIDADIEHDLRALSKLLQSGNKGKVLEQLEKNPEILRYVHQLNDLQKDFSTYETTEFEDDFEEIDYMKSWTRKYATILGINTMQYEIGFPNEVSAIQLYIAKDYDSLSRHFMAVNNMEESSKYDVYADKSEELFGVASQSGEIIIPAKYDMLERTGPLFFTGMLNGTDHSYRLDPGKKALIELPGNMRFLDQLSDEFTLFQNEDRYVGVLDKELKEVMPFRFDEAFLCGNIFVMTASYRGRPYKEFYTKEGDHISIAEKVTGADCSGNDIIFTIRNGKSGVLSAEGKVTVAPNYYIDARYDLLSKELVAYRVEDDTYAKVGMINTRSGKIIVPAEKGFEFIREFSEGLAAADFQSGFERAMGYINEQGQAVIPPQFLSATSFYKGLACVKAPDNQIQLINKNMEVVKTFPGRVEEEGYVMENYGVQRQWNDLVYYDINDNYYDYLGNPLSEQYIHEIENDDL